MQQTTYLPPRQTARVEIETLIARHGPWRVLAALATALLRRSARHEPTRTRLGNHLRRDIGLPEAPEPPPLPHRIGPPL